MTPTVMIQLCCCMPPFVRSSSQSLVILKSCFPSRRKHRQLVIHQKGRVMDLSSMQYLTLQFRLVQSQFLIKCHQPLWPKAQTKDSALGLIIPFVHKGIKPKGLVISKIRCKAVCKYLLQFNHLVLEQGVLHQIYITNDVESHQFVLLEIS